MESLSYCMNRYDAGGRRSCHGTRTNSSCFCRHFLAYFRLYFEVSALLSLPGPIEFAAVAARNPLIGSICRSSEDLRVRRSDLVLLHEDSSLIALETLGVVNHRFLNIG